MTDFPFVSLDTCTTFPSTYVLRAFCISLVIFSWAISHVSQPRESYLTIIPDKKAYWFESELIVVIREAIPSLLFPRDGSSQSLSAVVLKL